MKSKLKTPTKETKLFFINLYVRFLKNNDLYRNIKNLYISNSNEELFIEHLTKLEPRKYFTSFNKGWFWDEYTEIHNCSREYLNSLNYIWEDMLEKTDNNQYNWGNLYININ